MLKGLEGHLSCGERLRAGAAQPGEGGSGCSDQCVQIPWGGCREEGSRLLTVVPRDRMRGIGHKLKCRRFHLNIRRHF